MFEKQTSKAMEAYMDDMFIKSLDTEDYLRNLQKPFDIRRKHNMKLNQKKCAFELFLGNPWDSLYQN